jgi:RNA binding exosome subunit
LRWQKSVNIERTQYIGHYGVTFTVIRFTVKPNNRNELAEKIISGVVAPPIGVISSQAESMVENAFSDLIFNRLRNFHSAEMNIGLEAQVSGGIGPQRSGLSMHVYSDDA